MDVRTDKLNVEDISRDSWLIEFTDELVEYLDAYHALTRADNSTKATREISALLAEIPGASIGANTAGLKSEYATLLAFEKKYAFLNKDLSKKALELPVIGKYLVELE